ncbi:MAG: hypothetical protein PHX87_06165 [Candidatus Peribacteraceae bacterium]|nr:hypothetical protein [Candidatus Peribacteraceae bacterium]MDD5742975.1 hypothetical protein [Candidatus Peribacteraceae bacterium]
MHRNPLPPSVLLLGIVGFLLLSACGHNIPPPVDLPTGIQTMTGTLLPAEISTLRRGSHRLMDQNVSLCFVESQTVNLRVFEGKRVVVRGVLEPNSDPTLLPVLVTQDVKAVEQDLEELSLRAFGLHGRIPHSWIEATQKDATILLAEGISTPLVTITLKKETPLPASGAPFLISGHHAVRQNSADTGGETVTVESDGGVVVIVFTPPKGTEDSDALRSQWLVFLTSLSFTASSSAQASSQTQSPSPDGTPCGGTAGILCPEGQYCAIEDLQENIGHCRK